MQSFNLSEETGRAAIRDKLAKESNRLLSNMIKWMKDALQVSSRAKVGNCGCIQQALHGGLWAVHFPQKTRKSVVKSLEKSSRGKGACFAILE